MNRRTFIATATTVAGPALAGCSGGGSNGGGTETPATESDHEQAREALREASDDLRDAESVLTRNQDLASFDPGQVTRRVDAARDHLDEARNLAGDELGPEINHLEATADLFENFALFVGHLGDATETLEVVNSLASAERIEEARTELSSASDSLQSAGERFDDVNSALDDMETADLDDDEQFEIADTRERVAGMEAHLEGLRIVLDAYGPYLDGLAAFHEASQHSENEEFEAAAEDFQTAHQHFTAASDVLSEGEGTVEGQTRAHLISLQCNIDGLAEAADHFNNAMLARVEEDIETMQSEIQAAQEATDTSC